MTTVYKWRIYCITEAQFVDGYGPTPPTTCYHDATHHVNPGSVQQQEQYSAQAVVIQDEAIPTGGHFICDNYNFETAPSSVMDRDIIFKYPITILEIAVRSTAANVGDSVEVMLTPITVGSILDISETSVTVSAAAIALVFRGADLNIDDDADSTSLGRVTDIDVNTQKISFENPLPTDLDTHANISITQYLLKQHDIIDIGTESIQIGKSEGVSVQNKIRIRYYNNSESAKTARIRVTYFY